MNVKINEELFFFFLILCTFIAHLTHVQVLTHKLMLQLIN
jgi:hypothetical protein